MVREDLNVPMSTARATQILDYERVDAAMPTLRWLHERGARTIVLSHLGRPDGKPDPRLSLRPVAQALSDRLGISVRFADDCVGDAARTPSPRCTTATCCCWRTSAFIPKRSATIPRSQNNWRQLGDLYVNDAFATAHRAHASTEGVAHLLPNAAGFLMEAELSALSRLVDRPAKPFVCAIGGAKIKDKIGVLARLAELVDAFCVGGGMANTLLAAGGVEVGASLRDDDLEPAKRILSTIEACNVDLQLPTDAVVAPALDDEAGAHVVPIDRVGS